MARANAEEDQGSHSKALGHYQRAIEELLAVKTIEPKLFSPGSELHGLAQQLLAQTEALPEAQEAPELNDDYRSEWSEAQQHEQEAMEWAQPGRLMVEMLVASIVMVVVIIIIIVRQVSHL